EAIQMITSGITTYRSTSSRVYLPFFLAHLSKAHAELGQFDDAWRCIGEAMTAVETTKERWYEAEINRIKGRAEVAAARFVASGSIFRARAHRCACAAGEVLGVACCDEHGATLARSGHACGDPHQWGWQSLATNCAMVAGPFQPDVVWVAAIVSQAEIRQGADRGHQ